MPITSDQDHDRGPSARRGMPILGIFALLIGGCLVVLVGLFAFGAVVFPMITGEPRNTCNSNIKQLATGLMMYAQDYDNVMPPAVGWQVNVMPYVKNTTVFRCPDRPGTPNGFAYNVLLSQRSLDKIASPGDMPMLHESSLGIPNAADQLESFLTPHAGLGHVAWADGHVKAVPTAPKASAGLAAAAAPGKKPASKAGAPAP